MKKRALQAILISMILGTTVISGCAQSGNGSNNSEDKQVTINFWHNYSAQSAENEILTNDLIPQFEKEHPNIKVNAVSHEWADLHQKILISAQSDTLPDVARLDIAWIPEFQTSDILVPLNQEMTDFEDVSGQLLENAMDTATIGDHTYGLALNTNTKILFYNKAAFEDAGLNAPVTMDDFINAAETLSGENANGQAVWGYNEPALGGWNLCPFIWSMGGSITNEDETQSSGYINSPETIQAIETLKQLYDAGAITGWNSGDIPMTDGFGTGRYMMLLEGPWKIEELKGAYPDFEYEMCEMPAGSGGSVSVLGGEDIAMFKGAQQEAAWEFMKFMTGAYAQEKMAEAGQIPVNTEALDSQTVQNAPFAPFLEAIKTAQSRPTVSCWSEMDSELSVAVTAVMNGEKTAQEAMDELAAQFDELLQS